MHTKFYFYSKSNPTRGCFFNEVVQKIRLSAFCKQPCTYFCGEKIISKKHLYVVLFSERIIDIVYMNVIPILPWDVHVFKKTISFCEF